MDALRKIVITGGTGDLGGALAEWFLRAGWEVVVVGRAAEWSGVAGVRYLRWDGRTVGEWARELEGAFGVVNLAGRSVNCRYTKGNQREIMESRVRTTEVVGEVVRRCADRPRVWMNASRATIYKHAVNGAWDEEHGVIGATREGRDAFSIEVARAWEGALFAARVPGVRKVALRTAILFSGREGTVVRVLEKLTRLGLGGRMGSGEQWVSWVHEVDFCQAVEWLMEHEMEGVVNVAAPGAVRNGEMMGIFRRVCGRRMGLPARVWMLRVGAVLMGTEVELVLKSRRVRSGRLEGSGIPFRFLYPEMEGAVRDIIAGVDRAGDRTARIPSSAI